MAKQSDTSITETAAAKFIKDATPKTNLQCKKVTGFYLHKTTAGGSWRYRYTDAAKKRRNITIGRYSEFKPQQAALIALQWRNSGCDVFEKKQQEITTKQQERARDSCRQLKSYLEGPYTNYQLRKKSGNATLKIIQSNFSRLLYRDITSINRTDIYKWQEDRIQSGVAYSTINRAYGALRTMFNHALEHEIIDSNPLQNIRLNQPNSEELAKLHSAERLSKRRLLTPLELQSIYKALQTFESISKQKRRNSRSHGKKYLDDYDELHFSHWFHPFTLLALFTGFRPGDLYSLTWQELNLINKRIIKIPEKTRHHTNPARIKLPLSDAMVESLLPWWEQQDRPNDGLIFKSSKTGKALNKTAHREHWKTLKSLAGIDESLTFYCLRHNFISQLIAEGVPLLHVAQLAGHKSVSMIEKHYGHLCPETANNAIKALTKNILKTE